MFEPMIPFTPRIHTTDMAAVEVPKLDGLREPGAIDFDSDEPLACPVGRVDGEPCESCQ